MGSIKYYYKFQYLEGMYGTSNKCFFEQNNLYDRTTTASSWLFLKYEPSRVQHILKSDVMLKI